MTLTKVLYATGFLILSVFSVLMAFIIAPDLALFDSDTSIVGSFIAHAEDGGSGGDGSGDGGSGDGGSDGGGGCCGGGGDDGSSTDGGVGDGCCGTGGDDGADAGGSEGGDNVVSPPVVSYPAPTCTISAFPEDIFPNEDPEIKWTSKNATSATMDQGVGPVPLNGSIFRFPSVTTTYTLTVEGPGGTGTCSATITVHNEPAPTCTITAHPASLPYGGNSTITWTSQEATSASIDRLGDVSLSGSRALNNFISTISYKMTVKGPGGTGRCKVTITVAPRPDDFPSCNIWAEPSNISYGGNSTLRWTSNNANSATIDRLGAVSPNGSRSLTNFISTISYKLSVTGSGGTATCKTTVTVAPKSAADGSQSSSTQEASGPAPSAGYVSKGIYYSPLWWPQGQ